MSQQHSPPGKTILLICLVIFWNLATALWADVPGRNPPQGPVPNPGTQEQDLPNLTFPAPYNIFEFPVTCGGCHGGSLDQLAGHFGNWAGTNMASAARDPVFRANATIVNNSIKSATGQSGSGSLCFRCHSPNAWLSGRLNPMMGGKGDGSLLIHNPLLSTDDEGILCEFCHRALGSVTMSKIPGDPAFNMLSGVSDWPHTGSAYPYGPLAGNPLGDATLQINESMAYGGKHAGSIKMHWSDAPLTGSPYTGQTYGVYPPGWKDATGKDVGGQPVINPDDTVAVHFEEPICPPKKADGSYDYQQQALSLEHPTYKSDFISSSEFCGSCHDLTVPLLNHGMPEQRTYSEWKYSSFGQDDTSPAYKRCQDCHMPTLKHEYSDIVAQSLNPDPVITGWFPYAKDRNLNGGTSFHKFSGANDSLPEMMKLLYPEVDLTITGGPTGRDTQAFPGLMSSRNLTWNRTRDHTAISLNNATQLHILQGPTYRTDLKKWELQVKVTNTAGHRIPSGYPDGRRAWVNLEVIDTQGKLVYESGYYRQDTAQLLTTRQSQALNPALTTTINDSNNAVMVYQRLTGTRNPNGTYTPSPSLLNDKILFDNRIPPLGFDKANYIAAGTKFINYYPTTFVPYDEPGRYQDGVNYDIVTYRFSAPANASLKAKATLYWQTQSRDLMEYLKLNDTSTVRPEGPPFLWTNNYPFVPNYLSNVLATAAKKPWQSFTDLNGKPLRDNWGGIAYAAWLLSGKDQPYPVCSDSTAITSAPAVPNNFIAQVIDPFAVKLRWNAVPNADGYIVWVRYGKADTTASWDKIAIVNTNEFVHDGLKLGKTYGYKLEAFNGKGHSFTVPIAVTTPIDIPMNPINLAVVAPITTKGVTLTWYDQATNEQGFIIERQTAPPNDPFALLTRIRTPHGPGVGNVIFTDTTIKPSQTYNYRITAYNASGQSIYTNIVSATIPAK